MTASSDRRGREIEERIYSRGESLHAPHLWTSRGAQVLRRLALEVQVSAPRADQSDQDGLRSSPHPLSPFVFACAHWRLRDNFSAYDAAYGRSPKNSTPHSSPATLDCFSSARVSEHRDYLKKPSRSIQCASYLYCLIVSSERIWHRQTPLAASFLGIGADAKDVPIRGIRPCITATTRNFRAGCGFLAGGTCTVHAVADILSPIHTTYGVALGCNWWEDGALCLARRQAKPSFARYRSSNPRESRYYGDCGVHVITRKKMELE